VLIPDYDSGYHLQYLIANRKISYTDQGCQIDESGVLPIESARTAEIAKTIDILININIMSMAKT